MDRMLRVITLLIFGGVVGFLFNLLTGNMFLSFGMGFLSMVIVLTLHEFVFYLADKKYEKQKREVEKHKGT